MSLNNINRIKPYENLSNSSWSNLFSLSNRFNIPMNQRSYEWKDNEIKKILNDIYEIFEEEKYIERMGSLILLEKGSSKDIYDGQQRTITIILIINSIIRYLKKNYNDESLYTDYKLSLCINIYILCDKTEYDIKFIEKYGENGNLPKIYCINPYDNKALCDIFNTYEPIAFYYNKINDNVDNDEIEDNDVKFECKLCNIKCNSFKNFKSHLINIHKGDENNLYKDEEYENDKKKSLIYDAYDIIIETIINKKYDIKKLRSLYLFIMKEIDIQIFKSTDVEYVAKIFEWENNRGKPVNSLDIVKSNLLANIIDNKKQEVFDNWTNLKSKNHPIFTDYGKKIFEISILLYNKKLIRKANNDYIELYEKIIQNNKEDTYNEFVKFEEIINTVITIIDYIKKNRYGKLILTNAKCTINFDGFKYLLIPIIYYNNLYLDNVNSNINNNKLIKLITIWYYRNLGCNTFTFANLKYSNELIKYTNNYIEDKNFKYYDNLVSLFNKNCENKYNYINKINEKTWKGGTHRTQIKYLFLMYETLKTQDINILDLENKDIIDLEHIYPENKKNELSNCNNIDKIGNFTLFESKNSQNNHKGNRSVKDNDYINKKKQYKDSTFKITRELYEKYKNFTENDINKRSLEILTELNEILIFK